MPADVAHRFGQRPHHTLFSLSVPVMGSLIAEPLASLIDTAYVERLGVAPAAGLGAAATILFSTVWIFNFLNIGTQSEVARACGARDLGGAAAWARLALRLSVVLGAALALCLWLLLPHLAGFMSDDPAVIAQTSTYLEVRLIGVPAALVTLSACGALRGLSRMRLPLLITALSALINVGLDPLLIFGAGPIPGYGVAGAAAATVISQVLAAAAALRLLQRELPRVAAPHNSPAGPRPGDAPPNPRRLLVMGGDMVLRTGALLLFLLVGTRIAVHAGPEWGAIHQGVRQLWVLLAFLQDAFATSAQSLVGYFLGAGQLHRARRVAIVAFQWALGSGCLIGLGLLPAAPLAHALLSPLASAEAFLPVYLSCALAQPIGALAFATDGLLWGAGEYRYMRNAMLVSAAAGLFALYLIPQKTEHTLLLIWWVTAGFLLLRALLGVIRIVPGAGPVWSRSRKHNRDRALSNHPRPVAGNVHDG